VSGEVSRGGTGDPAAGSVGGQLGQTGRLGLATNRAAREERREGGAPPAQSPPGHGGEPAGRRNRPPEHQRWAGRRGPSDGGSRMPVGRCVRALLSDSVENRSWVEDRGGKRHRAPRVSRNRSWVCGGAFLRRSSFQKLGFRNRADGSLRNRGKLLETGKL